MVFIMQNSSTYIISCTEEVKNVGEGYGQEEAERGHFLFSVVYFKGCGINVTSSNLSYARNLVGQIS